MKRFYRWWWVLLAMIVLAGCASKIPHLVVPEFDKRGIHLIAVMPVLGVSDSKTADMLRGKLVEELYFKGYPKIPFKVVDEAMAGGNQTPQQAGQRLKVDGVLIPTIHQSGTIHRIIYASTTVDLELELRSVKTGERLWRARYQTVKRSYGFTRRQRELKTTLVYEEAIYEVVTRALETLPDAKDTVGS
ncbi:MAG: hypothetical protein LLG93_01730 [Deltaproteobacteria bacterium]|nr:hypothetical protein [Deltaproteobacteria bacterium]